MIAASVDALVVLGEGADPRLAESALPPDGKVSATAYVEGLAQAERAVGERSSDLLVVVTCGAAEGIPELVGRARGARPERPIVALAEEAPEYLVGALLDAGADDVVKLPETPERVLFAVEKAIARRGRDTAADRDAAPMICMLGPKGGTGKTVAASNLVVGLAGAGRRAVAVDLDLQFGDVGLALGLSPERTVYDLATSGGALDAEKLDAYLASHESGARVLLAPARPDQAAAVSIELLREVFTLLRSSYDAVVVDTPPDFTPAVIAAVDASSHVCMIGNMDSLSLKNTKLGLATLDLMDYDPERITLVLNRADSDVGLSQGDVESVTGRRAAVLVPSDRDVPRSLNEGVPIVLGHQRSPVAAAMRRLIDSYLPGEPRRNGDSPAGRRRLSLLRRSG